MSARKSCVRNPVGMDTVPLRLVRGCTHHSFAHTQDPEAQFGCHRNTLYVQFSDSVEESCLSKEYYSLLLAMWQPVEALGYRTRTLAWAPHRVSINPNSCGAEKPDLQGGVLKTC